MKLFDKHKILLNISLFIIFIYIHIFTKNNHLLKIKENRNINNDLKVCICLLCKEENQYIQYFLNIYKNLGFNHIFLYDNNDINGEHIEDVISKEIKQNFVTIINYRGFRGNFGGPQMPAYYDCFEKNHLFYDWIAFFDTDEYLTLNPNNLKIQQFLNNPRYSNCESIKINWKVFSDNGQLAFEDRPLNERFTEEVNKYNKINEVFKVILRGNLSKYSLRKSFNSHDIFLSNKSCDSNGKIRYEFHIKPEYKYAKLNHYYTKSIKEYCKKLKRGRAFLNKTLLSNLKHHYFLYFFLFNKKTNEKVAIFNNEFNTTFK